VAAVIDLFSRRVVDAPDRFIDIIYDKSDVIDVDAIWLEHFGAAHFRETQVERSAAPMMHHRFWPLMPCSLSSRPKSAA